MSGSPWNFLRFMADRGSRRTTTGSFSFFLYAAQPSTPWCIRGWMVSAVFPYFCRHFSASFPYSNPISRKRSSETGIDWGIYEHFAVIFPPAFRTFAMLFKNPGWSAKSLKERWLGVCRRISAAFPSFFRTFATPFPYFEIGTGFAFPPFCHQISV